MTAQRVLILHNAVGHEAPADAKDILEQLRHVQEALDATGYLTGTYAMDLDLLAARHAIRAFAPDVVFNLVEAIEDNGQLVSLATNLLDHMALPFTGSGTDALVLTSHKILTKRWLRANGIATADWWQPGDPPPAVPTGSWIVKPLWEDASIGMDDDSVVNHFAAVPERLAAKQQLRMGPWFAERFVDGREINAAVIGGLRGPEVLPIPEIEFVDFPADKPRIVGYAAKWKEDSFECRNTQRRFVDPTTEPALCQAMAKVAVDCWHLFDLKGYARVDCRVDAAGVPWVLEVNANPCIAPDAGFAAALAEAGVSYTDGVARLVADAARQIGRLIPR
jgi:D-alanine-D-alanine ligase